MRLHPTIEQHGLHLLAVGASVLLRIPREQFTQLRRVILYHNECTDDGTVLRTKIQDNGITVSRRDVIQIADTRDWQVGRAKPFLSQDELSLSYAVARANEAAKERADAAIVESVVVTEFGCEPVSTHRIILALRERGYGEHSRRMAGRWKRLMAKCVEFDESGDCLWTSRTMTCGQNSEKSL